MRIIRLQQEGGVWDSLLEKYKLKHEETMNELSGKIESGPKSIMDSLMEDQCAKFEHKTNIQNLDDWLSKSLDGPLVEVNTFVGCIKTALTYISDSPLSIRITQGICPGMSNSLLMRGAL